MKVILKLSKFNVFHFLILCIYSFINSDDIEIISKRLQNVSFVNSTKIFKKQDYTQKNISSNENFIKALVLAPCNNKGTFSVDRINNTSSRNSVR